jgi:hypothetical protein
MIEKGTKEVEIFNVKSTGGYIIKEFDNEKDAIIFEMKSWQCQSLKNLINDCSGIPFAVAWYGTGYATPKVEEASLLKFIISNRNQIQPYLNKLDELER